ncbi:leukocyte antigen CD37 isoform X2 [Brienomyrus brachyistius]|uniref:leukocyte antigen CD37 isoform X2 n=1 Tax=Brienomyrus brachyistius TaxID=42636 RepID=UPI0020B18406|nr:leukocyte antigen CD37 isoform X2 [Brienomyrus brachyistius]
MVSEGCFCFTKYLLFLFNLTFFLLGIPLASAGFWIIFGKTSFLSYGPTLMSIFPFACLLLIGGIISMLLGFFGCLGALKEVKCMLGMYFVVLAILLAIEIVAGVLFFTQMTTIEYAMEENMIQLMKTSKQNTSHLEDFKTAFNSIQRENKCCGWNKPSDWIDKPCSCYNSTGLLLNSTEQHNFNMECICSVANGTSASCRVYEEGCKNVIFTWLSDNTLFILALLLAVAAVEFMQILCLTVFCLSHHCQHPPKTQDSLFQASRFLFFVFMVSCVAQSL